MESAFGSSITNLGDLNMDGTNDIAIGAPGTDSGVGAVFIYHGNDDPNEGVYDEPTQVLYGKDLKETAAGILQHEMKGFGYSLSGGLDMDFNGYPDLLIGSLSDTAVLYRTRPIVNVEAAITSSVNKINVNLEKSKHTTLITLDSGTKYKRVTFNVTVCMSYTSIPATFNEYVNIKYTIKLDPKRLDQHLLPRASLDPYEAVVSSSATMSLYPQSLSKPRCKEKPVYVKKEVQDKLSPIEVSLEYEIVQYDITPEILKEGLHSTNDYPILNKDINNVLFTQVNISKNCGSDEICESNLRMTAEYVIFPKNSKNWEPLSTGSDGKPLLLVGNEKEIGIRVIVTNPFPGEDGHQAVLHVILPDFMHYVGTAEIKANTATASCNSIPGNSSVILCNLGNPFRANSSISAIIKLENNPKLYEVEQIETNFLLETSSVQKPVSFSYSASIRVQYYLAVDGYTNADQLPFSGEVVGESAVRTAEDAGLIVEHVYELENAGNDDVNEVYVNISWPQQTNNGKWLFYLLDSKVSGSKTNTSCNIPENLLNPLKLKFNSLSENLMEQKSRRRRRDTAAVSDPADIKVVSVNSSPNKVLTCSNFAKCLNFTCFVGKIDSEKKIFISVKGVIWNSTFLEEYYGVPEVRVYSNAKVWINRANIFHDVNSVLETSVSTSILAEKVVLPETKVSMWLVIVAIVSGVILLVVIVLILWRCGFFKRRRDFGDYHKARQLDFLIKVAPLKLTKMPVIQGIRESEFYYSCLTIRPCCQIFAEY
ncbi:unnamed protein product [Clavelina lepadiformis]|uniref:Integrin alpha-2 domain-containing protein n=1 Tax=Clavelina lepadiformis TaxID=159417 RepID=A0ABP0GTJ4_CLALP